MFLSNRLHLLIRLMNNIKTTNQFFKIFLSGILCCLFLAGCYSVSRLQDVGDTPKVTPIKDPTKLPNYHPITMPMPFTQKPDRKINSLWCPGARGFFKDQRAKLRGDILTVNIDIQDDKAEFNNETVATRNTIETTTAPNILGYETKLKNFFPPAVNPANLLTINSNPQYDGVGTIKRKEKIKFDLACEILDVLPNGNYHISGHQEIVVNFENRIIALSGVVRPEDISSQNTIDQKKIAELRITYGGRGNLSDMQQAPLFQQVLDKIR